MTRAALAGIVLGAVLLLGGCGTPYNKDNGYGGYTDSPVEKNLYHIVFTSPGGLDDDAIHDLALLRAADVSRDHGYPWFTVVRENKGYTTRAALAGPPDAYIYAAHPVWVPGPPGSSPHMVMVYDPWGPDWPGNVAVSTRFCELYIRGYLSEAAAEGKAYNAQAVAAGMRDKYKLKK
jgi:hypothetical protein